MISATATAVMLISAFQGEAPPEMRLMRYPDVHGENVVFSYAGDIWVTKQDGGYARRLTSHLGQEVRPKISPDGQWIAFTGQYEGNNDVFVIPIEGGEPKRITFEPTTDSVLNWTPDGRIMVASAYGNFIANQDMLWFYRPEGGPGERTKVYEIDEGELMADGHTLVYNRVSYGATGANWRRYRGGLQGRISMFDLRTNKYSELPSGREQSFFPMAVGQDIYYISDKRQGTHNLYRYNLGNKRETQLTQFADADIRWPSTDGKTIVFERDGYLYLYDIASAQTKRMNPQLRSDFVPRRPYLRRMGSEISSISLSPSGQRVVVEARGELFSLPAKTGETRNMTGSEGSRERWPEWSPNGEQIAYVSDQSGNYEVYVQPQMGGNATQLTDAKLPISGISWSPDSKLIGITTEANELYVLDVTTKRLTRIYKARFGLGSFDFSPDSKWIAYVNQVPSGFGAIHLYNVAENRSHQVTDGYYDDSSVSFDQNGKYLYFISTRTFTPTFGAYEFSLKVDNAQRIYAIPLAADLPNPLVPPSDEEPAGQPAQAPPTAGGAPVRIDLQGMQDRAIVLPMGPTNYPFVIGLNNGVLYWSGGTLTRFDFGSRESTPLMQGFAGSMSLNANRSKLAYWAQNVLGIVDLRPGVAVGQGRVDTSAVEVVVDPREEWEQIYWEAWRFQRDNFYDPNMLGLNWLEVGQRYAKYLPYVAHRGDLNYVIGQMIGELGTGHAYVSGGDLGATPPPIPVGMLGADYEVVGNNVRFAKIYKGDNSNESRRAPLSEPGVNVKQGEYLLAIDGKPVTRDVNPSELLINKVGRTVILTVNSSPNMAGSRQVRVRPIGSENNVRYVDFVEGNRRWVAEKSGGRIGYMHVPNTAFEGAVEFIRGFYSQTDKQAMVVDERWNGGGYIQPWFVDTLARRIKAGIQQRNAEDSLDAVAIEGPKAMLINGYAGSGGDFFPWMFKQQRLGPLIGMRTWGGLVGISGGAPLIDGGSVTSPEFAIYDRDTQRIIAENTGVDPDIEVDLRPDLAAQGRDPQLERAVEVLLEELRKNPPRQPRSKFPTIGDKGRIGGG